jgi:hypothetical protein
MEIAMTIRKRFFITLAAGLVSLFLSTSRAGADEGDKPEVKPAAAGTLVVIDGNGKEHTLKSWKFVKGTERLSWLGMPKKEKVEDAKEEKTKDGKEDKDDSKREAKKAAEKGPTRPESLVFRDDNSTDLQDGILTYIPMDRIRSIDFDNDNRTVTVHVLKFGKKGENVEILTGSTKFTDNKIAIEAESDLGDLGVASVKFQGGTAKNSIKGIRFPEPKVKLAEPKGRPAEVTAADKDKSVHKAMNLQPLYLLADRSQRVITTLLFKKTVKIDLSKVQKLAAVESSEKGAALEFEVTLKDGKTHTLILRNDVSPLDGKQARLLGFVGEVPAGYKFFPVEASPNNAFTTIAFDGADDKKDEKKGDKDEKKDDKKRENKDEKKDDKKDGKKEDKKDEKDKE